MDEPLTPLQESAASMRELYESYLKAGFNEDQALALTSVVLNAGIHRTGQ